MGPKQLELSALSKIGACFLAWIAVAAWLAPITDVSLQVPDGHVSSVAAALDRTCPASPRIELLNTPSPLVFRTVMEVEEPTAIAVRAGSIVIGSRGGIVREWLAGETEPLTLLDLSDDTSRDADQGLLDIGWLEDVLLVLRTDSAGATVLTAHEDDPGSTTGVVLLRVEQPDPRHNGGGLAILDGGEVAIGIGDGGLQGDPNSNAGNPNSALGKILRGRVDLEAGRLIPSGDRDSLVWVSGVRNPHRIWAGDDGVSVWITDVGENCREEVNRVLLSEPTYDLGWNSREGDIDFVADPWRITTDPLAAYGHTEGRCAVIGGTPAPDNLAALGVGPASIVADMCTGELFMVDSMRMSALPGAAQSPVALASDGLGGVLIAELGGRVRRLES
ncbi:MAG: PQQ-dependent sugar dehydrogenase [Actinomycetia bacterium]|nr:PQQ-dependent sugar dehydrogenase [Actinomycetes bacterium]MCP4959426.1 PQQ-dependent sugar dehydrogenase [Actinomycetes bacterium]